MLTHGTPHVKHGCAGSLHTEPKPDEHFITPQNERGGTYISGWGEGVGRFVAVNSFGLMREFCKGPTRTRVTAGLLGMERVSGGQRLWQ
jgi:hypothetical protein